MDLRSLVDAYLKHTGMSGKELGRRACDSEYIVQTLHKGRKLSEQNQEKLLSYMAANKDGGPKIEKAPPAQNQAAIDSDLKRAIGMAGFCSNLRKAIFATGKTHGPIPGLTVGA